IQSHYNDRLISLWRNETPTLKRIDLIVRSAMRGPLVTGAAAPAKNLGMRMPLAGKPAIAPGLMVTNRTDKGGGSPLDPRLSFSTFLVGRSNALAHAAARQVAEAEAGTVARFNPLYVHSAVGLGKTHLLQAIAWAGETGGRRVNYLTAEKFMY